MPNDFSFKKMLSIAGLGIAGATLVGYKLIPYLRTSSELRNSELTSTKQEITLKTAQIDKIEEDFQLDWNKTFKEIIDNLAKNSENNTLVDELLKQQFLINFPTSACASYKENSIKKFDTINDAVCFYQRLSQETKNFKTKAEITMFCNKIVKLVKSKSIEPIIKEVKSEIKTEEVLWKDYSKAKNSGSYHDEVFKLMKYYDNSLNDNKFKAEEVNSYSNVGQFTKVGDTYYNQF